MFISVIHLLISLTFLAYILLVSCQICVHKYTLMCHDTSRYIICGITCSMEMYTLLSPNTITLKIQLSADGVIDKLVTVLGTCGFLSVATSVSMTIFTCSATGLLPSSTFS